MKVRFSLSLMAFVSLAACGKDPQPPTARQPVLGVPAPESVAGDPQKPGDILFYQDPSRSVSHNTRIFLVAGGKDIANFAQEVIDQRKIWLKGGFTEDQIACYYAIPDQEAFDADKAQYQTLANDLRNCFPASTKRFYRDLRLAGEGNPEFLYLYVSSHGNEPPEKIMRRPEISFPQKLNISALLLKMPFLNQFQISMDVLPDGTTGDLTAKIRALGENQELPQDHLLTPRYLKEAVDSWPESVKKYITLQSCYSGGFLDAHEDKFKKDTLRNVSNISVISASRYDRTSFGCNPGAQETVFGWIYNRALLYYMEHSPTRAPFLHWDGLFDDVKTAVLRTETHFPGLEPSLPQHYSNFGLELSANSAHSAFDKN